jgi:hypothetical protein
MKSFVNIYFSIVLMITVGMLSCNSGETSNEESGDSIKTQDSSMLNNYGNEHPNDRIHMQDSNAAKDSSTIGRSDTARTRDSAR